MTDEGSTRRQGGPDTPSAPVPPGDAAVDRQVTDMVAVPVGPLPESPAPREPNPGTGPTAHQSDAAKSDGRVGDQDGGVTTRLARRCLTAAAVLIGIAALCLLFVVLRKWDVLAAVFALVSLLAIVGAVVIGRRWLLWTSVGRAALPAGRGILATTGEPHPLSPQRQGAPVKRRLGAVVLPIRAGSGATPGDGALIVHARADGAAPAGGDRMRVLPIARRGEPVAAGTDPRAVIRVLLVRDSDGTVFVATTRVTDTW